MNPTIGDLDGLLKRLRSRMRSLRPRSEEREVLNLGIQNLATFIRLAKKFFTTKKRK